MNGLPYYKAYPRDFIEGTIGLPFELKAAYRLLLDVIYMQGGKLPDDPRYISGLLGCSVRAWKKYREQLHALGKIRIENDFISNFRADKELETLAKLQQQQAENRSRPNKNKELDSPRCDHTEPEPEPIEKNTKKEIGFEEFKKVWAIKARKHDTIGQKALTAFVDAVNRGHAPEQIIDGASGYLRTLISAKDLEYIQTAANWLNDDGFLVHCESEREYRLKIEAIEREKSVQRALNVVSLAKSQELPETKLSEAERTAIVERAKEQLRGKA